MTNNSETVYSHNEEDWFDDFDEALEESTDECLFDHDKRTVYEGYKVMATHANIASYIGDYVINSLQEAAYDVYNEYSDFYLDDTYDKRKELTKVIVEWLEVNAKKPDFYSVENVKECTKDYLKY